MLTLLSVLFNHFWVRRTGHHVGFQHRVPRLPEPLQALRRRPRPRRRAPDQGPARRPLLTPGRTSARATEVDASLEDFVDGHIRIDFRSRGLFGLLICSDAT